MILNIDNDLGTAKDRIFRVGVELEGAWTKIPKGMSEIPRDGSVNVEVPAGIILAPGERLINGEIPSPVLQRKHLGSWMASFFPQYVNKTCGLHVHMSFANARHYALLMNKDYQDTMIAYLLKWAEQESVSKKHTFFDRMAGKNSYCKLDFAPDLQVGMTTKSYSHEIPGGRYTALNFAHGQHSTIECRLLPMFETFDLSLRAVERVLDITNASLVSLRRRAGAEKVPQVAGVEIQDARDINEHSVTTVVPHQATTETEVYHL
jgi:hypothetical protein